MTTWRWQDYTDVLLGVWITASPWVLGFSGELPLATWNAGIIGVAILLLATVDLEFPSKLDEWAMISLGAWSLASPWVLGFAGHQEAMLSMVAAGVAVIVLTGWELATGPGRRKQGHAHGQ